MSRLNIREASPLYQQTISKGKTVLRHLEVFVVTAFLSCTLVQSALAQQSSVDLNGRVFENPSGRGIENLEVKLTPPTSSNLPVRVANTDQNGNFHFAQVAQSRYMVEVSQGPNLLYRTEIETERQNNIDVPLQKR